MFEIHKLMFFACATSLAAIPAWAYYSALLVTTIGSTVAQGVAQKKNADAQLQYETQQASAANEVANLQASAARLQEQQAVESQAREAEKARVSNASARGRAQVSADAVGASGASYDAMLAEYDVQLGQYKEAVNRQTDLIRSGADEQTAAIAKGAAFQQLQIAAPVVGPNWAALGLDAMNGVTRATMAYVQYSKSQQEH